MKFRRNKSDQVGTEEGVDTEQVSEQDEQAAAPAGEGARTQGPWDSSEVHSHV